MSAEISKWRATYTPGNWVVLGGPSSLVVMQPAPARASRTINGFWDVIRTADSLDELMRLFAQSRLDQMPSFATFFWHKGEMRSIVRGKVQVVDAETGRALADGEGVQTWSETGLKDVKKVRVDMEPVDQDAVLQLPLATGVVLASAIYLDGTQQITSPQDPGVAVASDAPAEEPAAASKGQEAQEQEDHLTDADRHKLDQQMADLFGGAPKKDESAAPTGAGAGSSTKSEGGSPTKSEGAGAAGVAAAGAAGAAAGAMGAGAMGSGSTGSGAMGSGSTGSGAMGAGAAGEAGSSDPFDFAGQQSAPQQPVSQPSAPQQPAPQQQGFGGSPFQRPNEPGGFGQQPGGPAQPGQGMAQPAHPQSQPSPFAPPHSQASAGGQGSASPAPAGQGQGFGDRQTEPHVVQAPFGQHGAPRIILRPTTGDPVEVDRTVLIGRSPTASRVAATDIPKLLTVPSPSHDISRTHLQVTVEGGVVRATDLNSTNGTALIRPETSTQELLPAGEPVEIRPGCVLSLGDGVELHVEQA